MRPALADFLTTGAIGGLRLGMTTDEVRGLLGLPDDVDGIFRKHRRPTIYVYGSVELFFTASCPSVCVGIWWYAHRGAFRLTADSAGEQLLEPGMRREEVASRLMSAGLLFHAPLSGLR